MTRLMVLGLLRIKPMSGYEMQQLLQVSAVDEWAGILPGSIYHALKKMDKEGLVKVTKVETTGHRSKAIYEITDDGEQEYKKLLVESFRETSVFLPVHLYTGLSMLNLPNHQAEPDLIAEAIAAQIEELSSKMDKLEAGQTTKSQFIEVSELTKITFQNMLDHYKLQIDFLNKILKAMRNSKD
ncbi:PadR family transcriptional regulator [Bacillus sp. JJ1503]|uniref:PadR family transcriptional regulator n=1 Tax=unclassified Bacillus (in: firmicutes) TaxID=185979 RepID=UPI002FFF6FC6